jgi:hypothetical protein
MKTVWSSLTWLTLCAAAGLAVWIPSGHLPMRSDAGSLGQFGVGGEAGVRHLEPGQAAAKDAAPR